VEFEEDEPGVGPPWERPITAEQVRLHQASVKRLIAALPDRWAEARFIFRLRGSGAVLPERITNPKTGEGVPVPRELAEAASALHGYCRKFGLTWPTVVFTAWRIEGGWEVRRTIRS
jgi:hypothetical protein